MLSNTEPPGSCDCWEGSGTVVSNSIELTKHKHAGRRITMIDKRNDESYCTVKQIAVDPAFCFTLPMLRYYILHAHKNGLGKALRRIGRKVLIRRDLFIEWIEKQSSGR